MNREESETELTDTEREESENELTDTEREVATATRGRKPRKGTAIILLLLVRVTSLLVCSKEKCESRRE